VLVIPLGRAAGDRIQIEIRCGFGVAAAIDRHIRIAIGCYRGRFCVLAYWLDALLARGLAGGLGCRCDCPGMTEKV
jgi:hypothetical protein